jgi:hypothetical protein
MSSSEGEGPPNIHMTDWLSKVAKFSNVAGFARVSRDEHLSRFVAKMPSAGA